MTQPHVFISYQRADEQFARQARERLVAHGVRTWMDQYDIPVGAYWPDEIDKALAGSDVVVGILSPASVESRNVKNEWDWAIQNDKRLLLVQYRRCVIPHRYVAINYIDATDDQDLAFHLLGAALAPGDASVPAGAVSPAGATHLPVQSGPFVGREREIAESFDVLAASLAGQCRLLLLAGEPGIGKTRLAAEIAHEAARRGALVYWGRCHELEGAPPYWPWVEILREYVESIDRGELIRQLGADVPYVAQIVPELGDLAGDFESPQTGSEQARYRLFDAVTRFLERSAVRQPVVAVLDDLHWADEASLRLLEYVTRELQQTPLLLIGTYRDVEVRRDHPLARSLASLSRSAEPRRIALKGIAREGVEAYIRDAVGTDLAPGLVEAVHSGTEGNPFFVAEVVRLLRSDGRLETQPEGGDWTLSIPESVRDVIGRRLDQLPIGCNEILRLGAVVGREFTLDLLARVSSVSPEELLDPLDAAVAAHLIEETSTFGRYRFAHALIQQTLYEELTTSQRVRLHGQLGNAMEEEHVANRAPVYGELARHFAHAPIGDNLSKAIDYAVLAGRQAVAQVAWESAVQHFSQAVELLDSQPNADPARLCQLLIDLGKVENRAAAGRPRDSATIGLGAGGSVRARLTFQRAADAARAANLPEHFAQAALGVVGFNPSAQQGGVDALRLLDEALERLPDDDTAVRARILARRGIDRYMAVFAVARLSHSIEIETEIRADGDRAVQIARRTGDGATLAYTLAMSCLQSHVLSHDERLALAREAVAQATDAGDPEALCWGYNVLASATLAVGDMHMYRTVLGEYRMAVDRSRLPYFQWSLATQEIGAALREGRFEDAERWIDTADAIQPVSGAATIQKVWLLREQGRTDELLPLTDRFDHPYLARAMFNRGLREVCLVEAGQMERASQNLSEYATDGFADRRLSLRSLSWYAEVCAALGAVDHAEAVYRALLPHGDEITFGPSTDHTGGSVAYYLGILATTMAQWAAAERHFQTALDRNGVWGIRPYIGYTHLGWAEMLARRDAPGDRYQALEQLDQALALAREIGMVRLERKAVELRDRLRDHRSG